MSEAPMPEMFQRVWGEIEGKISEIQRELRRTPRICFAGVTGTGKSSLFNAIFGRPLAEVSNRVTTRTVQWGITSTFALADLPGHGAVGGEEAEGQARAVMREADLVVLVLQAVSVPTRLDKELFDYIQHYDRPVVLALNKIDLTTPQQLKEALGYVRELFGEEVPLVPVSALRGDNVDRLCLCISETLAESLRLSFARRVQHEAAKGQLVNRLIVNAMMAAAGLGSQPLPVPDLFTLVPLQVALVMRIAAVYGEEVSPQKARQFLSAAGFVGGAGLLFRQLFRELTRLVPVAGPVLRASVAAAGTLAVGLVAKIYYAHGGGLTPSEAREVYERRLEAARERLALLDEEGSAEEKRQAIEAAVEGEEER